MKDNMDQSAAGSGIETIFDAHLTREPFPEDLSVLDPNYVPDNLLHREKEHETLISGLIVAVHGKTPQNHMLYGGTGTGKTASVQQILDVFEKRNKNILKTIGSETLDDYVEVPEGFVNHVFIDCKTNNRAYGILCTINNAIYGADEAPFTGWSIDHLYETLVKNLEQNSRPMIVVLDEIDNLLQEAHGNDTLLKLLELNNVSIVGISNNINTKMYFDSRITSRLLPKEIVFSPYRVQELEDIFQQRADLSGTNCDPSVKAYLGATVRQRSSDVRYLVSLLRHSIGVKNFSGDDVLTEDHVNTALDLTENEAIRQTIACLSTQEQLVLVTIAQCENTEMNTGNTYPSYVHLAKSLGMIDLTQRSFSGMLGELDLKGLITAKVVNKGKYGRTKNLNLEVSQADITAALKGTVLEDVIKF